jgi:hypothetical protein
MDLAIEIPHPRERSLLHGNQQFEGYRREVMHFLETGAHQRRRLPPGARTVRQMAFAD